MIQDVVKCIDESQAVPPPTALSGWPGGMLHCSTARLPAGTLPPHSPELESVWASMSREL